MGLDEKKRRAESTLPKERKTHEPGQPLQMPEIIRHHSPSGTAPDATKPDAGTRPTIKVTPQVLTPGSRSDSAPTPPPPAPPPRSE